MAQHNSGSFPHLSTLATLVIGLASVTIFSLSASNTITQATSSPKVLICHVPSDNPTKSLSLLVSSASWSGHSLHPDDFIIDSLHPDCPPLFTDLPGPTLAPDD